MSIDEMRVSVLQLEFSPQYQKGMSMKSAAFKIIFRFLIAGIRLKPFTSVCADTILVDKVASQGLDAQADRLAVHELFCKVDANSECPPRGLDQLVARERFAAITDDETGAARTRSQLFKLGHHFFWNTRLANAGVLLAALAFSGMSAEAQVYKWTDKQGNVQYSDQPPPDNAAKTSPQKLAVPAPADANVPAKDTTWQEKELEFKKRRAEASAEATKRAQRQTECSEARGQLKWFLENGRQRLWKFNEKGDPAWLTGTERNAEAARVREFISRNCE